MTNTIAEHSLLSVGNASVVTMETITEQDEHDAFAELRRNMYAEIDAAVQPAPEFPSTKIEDLLGERAKRMANTDMQSDKAPIGKNGFRWADYAKGAIVGAEVLPPTSGLLRYGALALALTQTRDPAVGGAVLGLSTFGLEYASYRASLGWLADDSFRAVYNGMHTKWSEIRQHISNFKSQNKESGRLGLARLIPTIPDFPELPNKTKMNLPVQAGVALEFGTVPLLATKQLIEKDRDEASIKRDGRTAIAFVTGALALQGAAITEGAELFLKYTNISAAILGGAGVTYALLRRLKNRRNSVRERG